MGSTSEENRVIAVVTGANSGFGLGICHALLANLSVPSGTAIPAAVPQATAMAPALVGARDGDASEGVMPTPHPSLTLVLACRSEANAIEARNKILEQHTRDLAKRRKDGQSVPEGWEESLRVEYELIDLESIGGKRGILSFVERVKARYPYITSLFLNAGYAAFTQVVIPQFIWQILTDGYIYALHHPRYNTEKVGELTADGERGRVWSINVLAPYLMAKELASHLRKSPRSLPFEPRVVYTSSIEAEAEGLNANPLDDLELLKYDMSYRASKYMGDLVITQLDEELGTGERPIRCIVAEPGCVSTNIAKGGLGAWAWLVSIKWACYWLSFYVAHVLGSPHHPVWASAGAAPMLYAAFIANSFLLPASKLPAPKLHVVSRRWKTPAVKYGEVDEWDKQAEVARAAAKHCEDIRLDWHRREG